MSYRTTLLLVSTSDALSIVHAFLSRAPDELAARVVKKMILQLFAYIFADD